MAGHRKEILEYVGDDGEFLYAVDENGLFGDRPFVYQNPDLYVAPAQYNWTYQLVRLSFFLCLLGVIIGIGGSYLFPGDATWLKKHEAEILASNFEEAMICQAYPLYDVQAIKIYTVNETEVYSLNEIEGLANWVEIYIPTNDEGWYQLANYRDPGEGIVLAKYFNEPICLESEFDG